MFMLKYSDDNTNLEDGKIYLYFNRKKYEIEGIAKYYVGQTRFSLEQRAGANGIRYTKDNDKNPSYSKFANAIRKWGWNAFEGKILVDGIKNQFQLNCLEQYYIGLYDSYNNGYNCTLGGDGVTGATHVGMYGKVFTEEHRRKLSESHKGLQAGEKHPMYNKHHTEEAKQKIREKRKLQTNLGMQGRHHTEETKKRLSEISKEIQNRPDIKAKNRAQAMGNKHAKRTKVVCIELNMMFDSIKDAERYILSIGGKVDAANIGYVCRGARQHAGILNGVKLSWKYINNNWTNND